MALNQTQAEFITGGFGAQGGFGFARGVTERCEAVNAATGNCQRTSAGSFYNSAAAFVIGQASSAGRTLQVPDVYHLNARLYSSYIRDRWTATDKLTIDFGTRWEYFPGSYSTRSRDRILRCHDRQRPALRCRLHTRGLRDQEQQGAFRTARRSGVSLCRQMGRSRRIRPDERSVRRDGAHSGELSAADPGEGGSRPMA